LIVGCKYYLRKRLLSTVRVAVVIDCRGQTQYNRTIRIKWKPNRLHSFVQICTNNSLNNYNYNKVLIYKAYYWK